MSSYNYIVRARSIRWGVRVWWMDVRMYRTLLLLCSALRSRSRTLLSLRSYREYYQLLYGRKVWRTFLSWHVEIHVNEVFLVQVNFTKESYRRWLVDVYRVTTYNVKCMTLHGKRYIENVDREVRARKARIRIKNLISRHVSFSSWSSATVSPNIFRRSSTCTTGVLLAGASSTRRWSEDPAPSLLHPLTG